jgi:hypothetical protein
VGFVVTNGEARVDGSPVQGNSTLFQGSFVQAGNATSDLMFPGGSNLLLQPDSAIEVYRDYAVLQWGAVIQHGSRALVVDGLRISSLSPQSSVVVGMKDASHLEVAAGSGPAEVRTSTGTLVARLESGKALTFSIQDAPQSPAVPAVQQNPAAPASGLPQPGAQVTVRGMLRKDHAGTYGHYLLTDMGTKVTFELQGPGLDDLVGAAVEATGSIYATTPAETASRVLSVADIHQVSLNGAPGGAPEAPAAAEDHPTPSVDNPPAAEAGAAVPAQPGSTPAADSTTPPEVETTSTPSYKAPSDTGKIILIIALAAGAVVGVALGLGGGKSSTVSPE